MREVSSGAPIIEGFQLDFEGQSTPVVRYDTVFRSGVRPQVSKDQGSLIEVTGYKSLDTPSETGSIVVRELYGPHPDLSC